MAVVNDEPRTNESVYMFDNNCCQSCLNRNVHHSLSRIPDGFEISIRDLVFKVFSVEVKEDQFICSTCLDELLKCYGFKMKLLESQNLLKIFLSNPLNKGDDNPIYDEDDDLYEINDYEPLSNLSSNNLNKKQVPEVDEKQIKSDCAFISDSKAGLNEQKFDIDLTPSNTIPNSDVTYPKLEYMPKKEFNIEYEPDKEQVLYKRIKVAPERVLKIPVELALQINQPRGNELAKSNALPCRIDRKTFVCAVCKQKHASESDLEMHMGQHFQTLICDECGKVFLTRLSLLAHKRIHLKKDLECPYCKKLYRKYQLQHHIDLVHLKVISYKCPHCTLVFKTYHLKAKHIQEEHKESASTYQCDLCPKTFVTSSARRGHYRNVHLDIRNVACHICDAVFRDQHSLRRHSFIHNTERNFQCDKCHKSYKTPHHLSGHIKSHHSNDKL